MAYGTKCGENISDIFITEEELVDSITTGPSYLTGSFYPGSTCYQSGTERESTDLIFKGTTSSHRAKLQCLSSSTASRFRMVVDGSNDHGQLGNFTTINSISTNPIDCVDWVCGATGLDHTLAIRVDGSLWAWGRNNHNQIGDTNTISRSSPIQVSASGWKKVAAGVDNSFAISSNNQLYAWGKSDHGQTGIPTVSNNTLSTPLLVGSNYKCISAGGNFAIAIKTDNTLWTWGYNEDGRLGLGDTISRSSPVQLCSNKLWKKISAGERQSAAIDIDGNIYVWGCNGSANLGLGTTVPQMVSCPVQLPSSKQWRDVSINNIAGAAISTEGSVYVWGINSSLMLGTGSTTTSLTLSSPTINCLSRYCMESVNVNVGGIAYQARTNSVDQ